jgi:hypothetical protein
VLIAVASNSCTASDTVADQDADRAGWMLELSKLDLDQIATALADQIDYEHQALIDPRSGEIVFGPPTPASTGAPRSSSTNST